MGRQGFKIRRILAACYPLDTPQEDGMKRMIDRLPELVIAVAACGLWLHGPIPQLPHYHEFADQRVLLGVPNGADVLSNVGFAVVGLWGLFRLWPARRQPQLARGWPGYRLFLIALVLTALGSSFYHLDPDNGRLIWDRLPIALACAGLLAGVYAESCPNVDGRRVTVLLAIAAVLSVAWWYVTEQEGQGDLRPYLLLQGLPLLLIPLWQAIGNARRADRIAFGVAIALYAAAKVAELRDGELLAALGWISGHTAKHVLATVSAAVLAGRLVWRVPQPASRDQDQPPPRQHGSLRHTANPYGMFGTWH
jgi:hypothetical protein